MAWKPISEGELRALVSREIVACSAEQQAFFLQARIAYAKWRLAPWGDEGGGFWVVAVHLDQVLWYNDIEDGFNVSRFETQGEIPSDEYRCNQDSLCQALPQLQGRPGSRLSAPESV